METSSTCLSLLKVKTKTGKETKQLKNDVEHLLFKVKKKKKKDPYRGTYIWNSEFYSIISRVEFFGL